jgi:molecular chaperone GrpE
MSEGAEAPRTEAPSDADVDPQSAGSTEEPVSSHSSVSPDGKLSPDAPELTVESLVESLETVTGERDTYLDSLLRLQAEFENYRKVVAKRESEARERANEGLVNGLLPVLDACDGAVANGAADVSPIKSALSDALHKMGLERLEPTGAPFDPEQHEAVMHEPAEGTSGPTVAEVLRAGYQWKGRTLRPAMVRVTG